MVKVAIEISSLHGIHTATIMDTIPGINVWSSHGPKGGRVVILPVDMKHGEINKELGLPSDYTTAVESFMRSLGLPQNGLDGQVVRRT